MRPGRPSPVYVGFVRLFPPAQHLRVPPRILLLATFGLAVLGAEGLALCTRRRKGADRSCCRPPAETDQRQAANLPRGVAQQQVADPFRDAAKGRIANLSPLGFHTSAAAALPWLAVALLVAELWSFQRGNFHRRVVRYYPPDVALSGEAMAGLAPLFAFDGSVASEEPVRAVGPVRPAGPDRSDKPNGAAASGRVLPPFRLFRLIGRDDPDYLMDSTPEAVRNRWVRLQPNLGMTVGVADIEGYEEGLLPPLRYFDFLNFFNRNLRNPDPDAVLLGLMNVRYLYCDAGQPIRSAVWRAAGDVVEPATGRCYRLYENPLWLPRVVWADQLPSEIDLARLRGEFSRSACLSERMNTVQDYGLGVPPRLASGMPEAAVLRAALPIRAIEPNRILVENPSGRGGRLLIAQNAFPGWIVAIGGRAIPLVPATDFSAMAEIPAGAEEFAILYRPFSFRIGAYLSGIALTVWIGLLLLSIRRVRRFGSGSSP